MTKRKIVSPEEELIREMEEILGKAGVAPDDPGLTSYEWAEKWGCSHSIASDRLRYLHRAGRLTCGKRRITTVDGRPALSPVYRAK